MVNYLGFPVQNNLFLAPMAGVTDRPFRKLCKKLGAGIAVSEMVHANSLLYGSKKTRKRIDHTGEISPKIVQLVGADAELLAQAAKHNVEMGAEIIDFNMGCPVKKICNVSAGSALMKDIALVEKILTAIRHAVKVPVTLKMRTGWDYNNKNALQIAFLAEKIGINAITIHGRTRSDLYNGNAEYHTISEVKKNVRIPIIANGDINSAIKAKQVLEQTNADGIMIGRWAQGQPWIFAEIVEYLKTGKLPPPPSKLQIFDWLSEHLEELYSFYGITDGVKIARKHIGWYAKGIPNATTFRSQLNQIVEIELQRKCIRNFFLN